MEDFTKSFQKNKKAKLIHLRDQDKASYWIKEQNSSRTDYDLELELTLTHYYSDSIFKKKVFHTLSFFPCAGNAENALYQIPTQLHVDLFLREAINIDKELRLPMDTKIASYDLDFKNANKMQIDLSNTFTLQDSSSFPENIFIVTLYIKDNSKYNDEGKTCLSEIEIE